eukprot:4436354-Prymnesium_polylepis.1
MVPLRSLSLRMSCALVCVSSCMGDLLWAWAWVSVELRQEAALTSLTRSSVQPHRKQPSRPSPEAAPTLTPRGAAGVVFFKCASAIVVGYHDSELMASTCRAAVRRLADRYLKGS